MEKNNTKLFLEVDASQIDVKQLLKKDFLELSMKAISSANPNRNNSWFTRESMERSLGSFVNKPVLGYFENGDFVSHDGDWQYDSETGMDYWDTLGKKGERILGIIRESDEVKIVEDDKGLSWVTFSCALWVEYNFKQVKRLIKDAKRAQQTGESAKNISVEVDITDYEMLDNGVMKINEFKLVGVTILGSRNGVKVEPGIENAELSVVDIMGRENFSRQEKSLRLAYEKLNCSAKNKEEESQMENKEVQKEEVQDNLSVEESATTTEECTAKETQENKNREDNCGDCGSTQLAEGENKPDETSEGEPEKKQEETEGEGEEGDKDKDKDEGDKSENKPEQESENKETECGKFEEECCPVDPVRDVAYLIANYSWNLEEVKNTIEYYEKSDVKEKEYAVNVLKRIVIKLEDCRSDLAILLEKLTSGVTEEDYSNEQKFEKYSNALELIQNYENSIANEENLKKQLNEATEKIQNYEHQEFISKAYALIKSAKLSEEDELKFEKACDNSEITNIEDLKVKVAVAAFESKEAETVDEEKNKTSFSSPISTPNIEAAFENTKEKKFKNTDPWAALREYTAKK